MSELGTLEKKSLVARFDENNVIRIVESPEDPDILFINFVEDGVEKAVGLSIEGDVSYPVLKINIINNSSYVVNFTDNFLLADYGIATSGETVAAGLEKSYNTTYVEYPDYGFAWKAAYVDVNPFKLEYSDAVNCIYKSGYVVIIEPSKNSEITITATDL